MNSQELPLRDIHLPDPISWWPPAPGWWLLALGVLAVAIIVFTRLRRPKPGRSVKADSRLRLESLVREYDQHRDAQRLLGDLSSLLRRVSLSFYDRTQIASLTGEAWLAQLDRALGGDDFSRGAGRALAAGPYRPNPQVDSAGLLALCRRWIDALPEPAP